MNIKLKINVLAIDKLKLFKGEKGIYLDAVMIETPGGQYSDFMIVQDTTAEERTQGVKGAILGNASYMKPKVEQTAASVAPQAKDDLPF
jgi:DNA-binding cell septation regulator SpoVG